MSNLLEVIPAPLPEELTELLDQSGQVRIERIVSRGHSSPEGFWYDQELKEFVLLLSGAARLEFEGKTEPVSLKPGDYLIIDAHQRHRVAYTAEGEDTVWLAVHYP